MRYLEFTQPSAATIETKDVAELLYFIPTPGRNAATM